MLEVGKTYKGKEFFEKCKVGKAYRVTTEGNDALYLPFVDPKALYFSTYDYVPYNVVYVEATNFIKAFAKFLGNSANKVLGKENFKTAAYYADVAELDMIKGTDLKINLSDDTVDELMDDKGIEDIEELIKELEKLPDVDEAYEDEEEGGVSIIVFGEMCGLLGHNSEEFTIIIKSKTPSLILDIKGDDGTKGILEYNHSEEVYYDLEETLKLTVNEIF